MAQASGRAFLGIIKNVRETLGPEALTSAIASGPEPTRRAFQERIDRRAWYPYEAFSGFLEGLASKFGEGNPDYARFLGAASGIRDINTAFRIYLRLASPERLIRACSRVWPYYYRDAGTMEATEWKPERTTLRITGFAEMSPLHCQLMEGWMISTMEAIGLRIHDDARESKCTSRGDPFHEFTCSWSRR
jgi:hypothetical protein